jgi:hypothetical protein
VLAAFFNIGNIAQAPSSVKQLLVTISYYRDVLEQNHKD